MADKGLACGINRVGAIPIDLSKREVVDKLGECIMMPIPVNVWRTLNWSSACTWGTSWASKKSAYTTVQLWMVNGTSMLNPKQAPSSNGTTIGFFCGTFCNY